MKSEKIVIFVIIGVFLFFIALGVAGLLYYQSKQANSVEIEITSIIQFEKSEIENVGQFMEKVIDVAKNQIKPHGPYNKGEIQWLFTDKGGMIGARLILRGKKEL